MPEANSKMQVYLAEIYRLSEYETDDGFVSTSALAEMLNVSPPAVNRMVNKLREADLLIHEPYHGIQLTPKGKQEALVQLRRHRIAEVFLVNVMGLNWREVYEEARELSQGTTEVIIQRMAQMAGNPLYCPHGEPIPASDGEIPHIHDFPLAHAEAGHKFVITRLKTRDPERLQYLEALGLLPNVEVEVLHVAPFHGPMQLKLNREYRIIGHNLAELIRAKQA